MRVVAVGDNDAMARGIVYVVEELDDDMYTCTGRWSAHWQDRDEVERGPDGLTARGAIAWGRARADVVLVSPVDTVVQYSAGIRHPPENPLWPDGQELPRRPSADIPARDHGDGDAPCLWRVSAGTMSAMLDLAGLADGYDASLRADRDIDEVLASPHVPAAGRLECEFTVSARTAAEARVIALDASERALDAAAIGLGRTGDGRDSVLPASTLVESYVTEPVRLGSPD